MAHLIDKNLVERANTALLLGILWGALATCVLGYFVLHIIGKTVRFVGAFAPVLRVVNKGGRHKVMLKRPPQVARTLPPRFHPFPHNQTDHYPT